MPTKIEKDEISGQHTTGHEWDGIRELNTPMPRWWLWVFYACVAFSVVWWVLYPAWPVPGGFTRGVLGYSTRAEQAASLAEQQAARTTQAAGLAEASLEDIAKDPAKLELARAIGKSAFALNCAQCHGSGAQGFVGFPNLNDDAWVWGGTLDQIATTLQHGIRWAADPDTRQSQMPAFGADGTLTAAQISDVADYVMSLRGQTGDAEAVKRGEAIYAENCAACHQDGGVGSIDVGAPRLASAVNLYGGDKAAVVAQVTRPRHGVMPAWGSRLDPVTIKSLTVYVHSLGGGQ
jgi:cytochrome c oxidase cbb3-type subunit 3